MQQQPTLNLGQPTWECEHFDAGYQFKMFKMLRTTGVRSLPRFINTKNVANNLIGVSGAKFEKSCGSRPFVFWEVVVAQVYA